MKKKPSSKATEIIFINLNESLKKTIHENMSTVYDISIDRKKKSAVRVRIKVNGKEITNG